VEEYGFVVEQSGGQWGMEHFNIRS